MNENNTIVSNFFSWIVSHPKRVLFLGISIMIGIGSFIPQLTKDTRADAFLADDNQALVYRDTVKRMFGLSDPIVVAVVAEQSIFTTHGLNAISMVTDAVTKIENVDPDGITSLATENNIVGTYDGMDVSPFFEGSITTREQANEVKKAIDDFPLYQGSLVARDGSAALVVIELIDDAFVEDTYEAVLDVVANLNVPNDISFYVAGEGAIAGYLGSYIDSDAQRLNPIAGVVITIIVFIAFLRGGSTLMANVVIGASAAITMGLMAAFSVPFYVITNALPVILIGISVADSIHIYNEYFERRSLQPSETINESIVNTMVEMWRPITLTTLTTAAGFMGLYFAAYMPPFKMFGLFTAIGVSAAWFYSLMLLPAAMALLKTNVHPKLARQITSGKRDIFSQIMMLLGQFTTNNAKFVVSMALLIIAIGGIAATKIQVNEDRIDTFHPSEPLYIADTQINARFDGTNNLDIVIETPEFEGIFEPKVLRDMEALQAYAETLPHVQGSTSIVDYLKQMNRSLNEGDPNQYALPDEKELIAQYFLLYSASGEPTDFEEEVDYDYRIANVRLNLNEGSYLNTRDIVLALQDYIQNHFNSDLATATLTGRVNLNYHWIKDLGESHFFGMGIALFLVWLVSSYLFRSTMAGIFALVPVVTSILLVYSSMVLLGIPLGIGTSMFAAVAIGLGVDFSIHTIDRLKTLYQKEQDMQRTLSLFYPSTGRALLFNLLAIALGFGVLISSKVVPLNNFGSIVAISVTTSFLISLTLLPAMVMLFKPKFVTRLVEQGSLIGVVAKTSALTVMLFLSFFLSSKKALSEELPEGRWVAEKVNAVEEGSARTAKLHMKMVDRRGKERERKTLTFRKYFGDEKRTVLFYLSPKNVKDTGFLTWDYPDAKKDDDQWLYLPALRKARRISASDRGDYFLGTDFTYEDIKKEGKFELADYQFITLKEENVGDLRTILLEGKPVDEEVAKELGYGKFHAWINPQNWVVVKAEYWDISMNPLKSLEIKDIRQVDGIWTRHHLLIDNHKTGHSSEFVFSEVSYGRQVDDRLFSRNALTRGAPKWTQ